MIPIILLHILNANEQLALRLESEQKARIAALESRVAELEAAAND